jgi:hypothetical protein
LPKQKKRRRILSKHLDAIVLLGKYQADRAQYPVRLVQYYHYGQLHRYLTHVLDPHQLSLADLARLYGRKSTCRSASCGARNGR